MKYRTNIFLLVAGPAVSLAGVSYWIDTNAVEGAGGLQNLHLGAAVTIIFGAAMVNIGALANRRTFILWRLCPDEFLGRSSVIDGLLKITDFGTDVQTNRQMVRYTKQLVRLRKLEVLFPLWLRLISAISVCTVLIVITLNNFNHPENGPVSVFFLFLIIPWAPIVIILVLKNSRELRV